MHHILLNIELHVVILYDVQLVNFWIVSTDKYDARNRFYYIREITTFPS